MYAVIICTYLNIKHITYSTWYYRKIYSKFFSIDSIDCILILMSLTLVYDIKFLRFFDDFEIINQPQLYYNQLKLSFVTCLVSRNNICICKL